MSLFQFFHHSLILINKRKKAGDKYITLASPQVFSDEDREILCLRFNEDDSLLAAGELLYPPYFKNIPIPRNFRREHSDLLRLRKGWEAVSFHHSFLQPEPDHNPAMASSDLPFKISEYFGFRELRWSAYLLAREIW